MQKTLGGDRLGSGSKMKVELHNYERSTHNLGYLWRSTMSAGTLVPFMCEVGLPGDTFDIELDLNVMTHPTVGPLFASEKIQLDTFMVPIRLYNSLLHNNALGIGLNMANVKLPILALDADAVTDISTLEDIDNSQINPSCILSYLGIRGIGMHINSTADVKTRTFNGVPFLGLWDIYKNYYANKQEEIGAVIHTPVEARVLTVTDVKINSTGTDHAFPYVAVLGDVIKIFYTGATPIPSQITLTTLEHGKLPATQYAATPFTDNGTYISAPYRATYWGNATFLDWGYVSSGDVNNGKPKVQTFDLSKIDDMRTAILSYSSKTTPFDILDQGLEPYIYINQSSGSGASILRSRLNSQEGLPIKTYQSDLFNNWLQTDWIDGTGGISEVTAIDTSGGSFTIDTLNLSKKVYNMLNRIAVSGGTYDDWLDAVYAHDRYTRAETPVYMGGLIKELVFQQVISNSSSNASGANQPLGTLGGRGALTQKHKGGKVVIKCDEPCYIMGIASITPRIDYSQGNKWDIGLTTLNDLHKPALDEIGFQDLITEQMAWWSTAWDGTKWVQKSAGKQPAWLNYMTNVNQTRGNFAIATNEMFMTLNRRYEAEQTGSDVNIKDLTTYIDPSKYNFVFSQTSLDAQNYWTQIAVDITARRKMSAKIMPNL